MTAFHHNRDLRKLPHYHSSVIALTLTKNQLKKLGRKLAGMNITKHSAFSTEAPAK